MITNPLTLKDGYKTDHRSQYPQHTQEVYSNFTPRSTRYAAKSERGDDKIVLFGLQYFIKECLIKQWNAEFFQRSSDEVLDVYKRRINTYLGPIVEFTHIKDLHDLGHLPIEIKALPEGSSVNAGVPLLTIRNTDPRFFWLTNYLETVMSCMLWKPCTSATIARKYRATLDYWCEKTGGSPDFVPFQGHDFSFRGMSGLQDAQMSGAGHLLSFVGTDTIPAIDFLEEYYKADCEQELIGCSVPATEHSVMCMGGKGDEIGTFKRLINDIYPKGIISIVSDTWDFWKVMTEYLPVLKGDIMARDGKVVIRPDSGDPVDIICGRLNAEARNAEEWGKDLGPEMKGAIEVLWDTFGGTTNDKGFKELDPHIGLIYGDSITLDRADQICQRLHDKGFASTNIVLGIGSYTYEYVTRDTYGFAMKATAGVVNGDVREIFKDPKTDDGSKKSAKGYLSVTEVDGEFVLSDQSDPEQEDLMKTVFKDGYLLIDYSLSEIRDLVSK